MLNLSMLESRIGYEFRDKKLLRRAVTHRSFAQEHNERLEFLGDSVLNCVIGYALFLRDRHFTEGELSRVRANLVCEKTLHDLALTLDLSSFLFMGEGELKTGGARRASILADAMEAIFGAVFFEAGFEEAQKVVLRVYEPILSSLTPETFSKDPKTRLSGNAPGLAPAAPGLRDRQHDGGGAPALLHVRVPHRIRWGPDVREGELAPRGRTGSRRARD